MSTPSRITSARVMPARNPAHAGRNAVQLLQDLSQRVRSQVEGLGIVERIGGSGGDVEEAGADEPVLPSSCPASKPPRSRAALGAPRQARPSWR
jgi:hypothetical protein